ncbi:hypothetical protein CPB86DRAFT_779247 [Serendipita vermifera]|nr:hypothetical protein CPB86DRAFT_779247 [Serendipita vermifera]
MSLEPGRTSRSPSSPLEDDNDHEQTADSEIKTEGEQVDGAPPQDTQPTDPAPPLSKKAQKRILKAKKREEFKLERRAKEKEAKKAKKAAIRAAKEAEQAARRDARVDGGEGVADDKEGENEDGDGDGERARKRRKGEGGVVLPVDATQKKARARPQKPPVLKDPFGAKIVIDLGFDEKMTEREIISLVSQCAYCYSSNRKATQPFSSLLYTSLNGRTKVRLDTLGTYQNWRGVEWWEEGYEELWADATTIATASTSVPQDTTEEEGPIIDGESSLSTRTYTCPVTNTLKPRTSSSKDKVVYLTADSDFELSELDPTETYIIGGIVDKNRYKALCADKAQGQGIRTARLPIGVYLKELPTRKVLTVNQVFDILVHWVEWRDWKRAFLAVVPPRKFNEVGKGARRKQKGQGGEGVVVVNGEPANDEEEGDSDLDAEGEDDDEMNGDDIQESLGGVYDIKV